MESLKMFSEAIAFAKIKKMELQKIMGQVKLECQNVEDHSRMMKDLFTKYSCELESKEKLLKAVQESQIQRSDSKKSVEEGLKKLDEKERFLKVVLQEVHEKESQVGRMRDSVDEQLKEIVLREQQFHSCFGELKLVQTQVERKANEIDSLEKSLMIRAEEIDSREKKLDTREHEADVKEQTLQGRQNKLDSREKDIDSKLKILARREKEGRKRIESRGRLLEKRENDMDSELDRIERNKFELLKKEDGFVNLVKESELKRRFSDLKLKLDSRKKSLDKYIQVPWSTSSAEVVKDRRKRCLNSTISDADQWMNKDGNQAKRSCYSERSSGQLKLHDHEKSSKVSTPTIQIQNELEAREFEVSAESAQGIRIEGSKRGSGDGQLKLHDHEKSSKVSNPTIQIQNEFAAREFEVSAESAQGICIEGSRRGSGDGQLKLHDHEKSSKVSNPTIEIQIELEAREFEVSAESAQEICIEGNRRGSGDGYTGEVFIMDSQRQDGKRQCLREGLTEHIKAPRHPLNSGSNVNLEAKTSQNVVIVEESESSMDNCLSVGKFNVGDVWCCFDSKDNLPRSLVQITRIIVDRGEEVKLKVIWLKPCPVSGGEKEWIDADLPVTCGKFRCSRSSIESPRILSHLASSISKGPWTIIPRIGEIWAIYKDWDISTWSSNLKIHENCKYEIVEVLSYHKDGSSPCFRVAYLNKIPGSLNSFECISYEYHSFLIKRSDLFRFSHRVPSVKNGCNDANGILHFIFELDKRSLPKGLL